MLGPAVYILPILWLAVLVRADEMVNTRYDVYTWDSQGWKKLARGCKEYDGNCHLERILVQDTVDSTWRLQQKIQYFTSLQGVVDSSILSWWYDERWNPNRRKRYRYHNERKGTVYQDRFSLAGWEERWKTEYKYANEHCDSIVTYLYDTGKWVPVELMTNRYSEDLLDSAYRHSRKDSTWVLSGLNVFKYDTKGSEIGQTWLVNSDGWLVTYRYLVSRNLEGKMLTQISEVWNNGSWQKEQKMEFSYDWVTASLIPEKKRKTPIASIRSKGSRYTVLGRRISENATAARIYVTADHKRQLRIKGISR